jgi:hypothetical protein
MAAAVSGVAIAALVISLFILMGSRPAPAALASSGLTTGFGGGYYASPDPAVRGQWLSRTVAAGAGMVKLDLPWDSTAPNRPEDPTNPDSSAYNFVTIDAAVRDASAHGVAVMLLVGGTPFWAQAPGRPANVGNLEWNPNPSDLANFMRAVAARYSGSFDPDGAGSQQTLPAVEAVEIWNEPNASGALSPQYEGKTAVAPAIYRNMLNASYDAVKAVNPRMLVVTGGTDPYGGPPGTFPDIQLVPPITFWQDVLCVRPVKGRKGKTGRKVRYVRKGGCNGPVKFDVLAHHPIDNTGSGPLAHGPMRGDVSTPDLGRITQILRGAEAAGTTLAGSHPVWVTEFWWDSKPPNSSGAKLGVQARWIEQSLYLFWKGGASAAINLVVGDVADYRTNARAGYQGGAYFQDGRPKPALTAFQFPFVTSQLGKSTLEAWGKSPLAGKLLIQHRQGSGWRTVRSLNVDKGSVFLTRLKLSGKQRLRALVGGEQSLIWKSADGQAGQRQTPGR